MSCNCTVTFEGTRHVPGEGPLNAKMVLVGEAPGETEDLKGTPFAGGAGMVLNNLLFNAKVPRSQLYITNVVKHRPPNNKIKSGKDPAWEYPSLNEELFKIRPQVIVPLGNTSLNFFGRHGIYDRRGGQFLWHLSQKHKEPGIPNTYVVPTIHPANLMRDRRMFPVVVQDLKKAWELANKLVVEVPKRKYLLYPTPAQAAEYVSKIQLTTPVSVDIETTYDEETCLLVVGLCTDALGSICIPFEEEFLPPLLTFFKKNQNMITQNGIGFDMPRLRESLDMSVRTSFDTMIAHHLVCSSLPHDLGFLNSVYADLEYYKDMDTADPEYNCMDTDSTLQCAEGITADLKKNGMWKLYQVTHKAAEVMQEAREWGACFHLPTCIKVMEDYQKRCDELEARMKEVSGNKWFNPDSPRDVADVLYNKLKLPPLRHRKTRKITTEKKQVEKKYGHIPFVKDTIEYRHKAKMMRTYVPDSSLLTPLDGFHGIYHPDWKVNGTETGRYSCDMHTFPPEMRHVVVARPGYVLVKGDFSQIEFRIDMFISKDPVGLEVMSSGGDIHRRTAAKAFELPEEEITDVQRFMAKFVSHGCRYGRGVDSVAEQFNCSMDHAQDIVDSVLLPFEVYLTWREDQVRFANVHGYNVNYFHRRRYWLEGVKPTEVYAFGAQSTAHDITMQCGNAMYDIIKEKNWDAHLVLDHHDALMYEVRPEIVDVFKETYQATMELEWIEGLSIPGEVKVGKTWGEFGR